MADIFASRKRQGTTDDVQFIYNLLVQHTDLPIFKRLITFSFSNSLKQGVFSPYA
jgi:hypothetical protein